MRGKGSYEIKKKWAKSSGLKTRNTIILFLNHKFYDIIYPNFLSEGNELPSGFKIIS